MSTIWQHILVLYEHHISGLIQVGKWHLGYCHEAYLPTNRGFHSFLGQYNHVTDYYTRYHTDYIHIDSMVLWAFIWVESQSKSEIKTISMYYFYSGNLLMKTFPPTQKLTTCTKTWTQPLKVLESSPLTFSPGSFLL